MPRDEGIDVRKPKKPKPVVTPTYTPPAWNDRRDKRTKKGNIGTGESAGADAAALGWDSAGEMAAQQQNEGAPQVVPAWQQNILRGGTLTTNRNGQPFTPVWTPPNYGTGSFFAGGGNVVRMGEGVGGARVVDTSRGTRWVRTGEGTMTPVAWQPGMLTGSFFSGGNAALNPPSGEDYTWTGNTRNENVEYALAAPPTTTTGGGGGGTGGGGWGYGGGRGGGGGGGGYQPRTPSWLMNLYNWNFK